MGTIAQVKDRALADAWNALRQAREDRGISAAWAARQCGVDTRTLYRWEHEGSGGLTRFTDYAAKVLHCNVAIFLPGPRIRLLPIGIDPGEIVQLWE